MNKAVGVMLAVAVVGFTQVERMNERKAEEAAQVELAALETSKKGVKRRLSGTAKAYRDRRGHFMFRAMMNGKSVKVLVDTGATDVAMPLKVAKRIGIRVRKEDFRHTASTANGTVKFARARIRDLRIDGVRVRNVEAAVLPNEAMSGVLLGMSFLKKLKSFQINGRTLTLKK